MTSSNFPAMAAAAILVAAGTLAAAPAAPAQGVVPQGSYQQSCSGAFVNQGRLYANCRNTRGGSVGSSIDLAACSNSEIGNDNGMLACGAVRGRVESSGGGQGQGRARAVVYPNANYSGQPVTFTAPMANLASSGINDQISSMQLQGSWQACSDANYSGSCQTFSGNVSNLSGTGLNDAISSLRPQN